MKFSSVFSAVVSTFAVTAVNVFWEEDGIVPILALEVVSQTYNGEYQQKKIDYAELGILYYVIYAPTRLRRKRQRLEVYRLVDGQYILQPGEKIWMPEIGLSIGREQGTYQGRTREGLLSGQIKYSKKSKLKPR